MVLHNPREYSFIMTSYVVIQEEIDLMIEMDSREERKRIGELMKGVSLDTVLKQVLRAEIMRAIHE